MATGIATATISQPRNSALMWRPLFGPLMGIWGSQMALLRTEIETALDDLISNEDGMRFQGLAVILAKKRWPDFIACERKKDLGADAIGSGKILACSLTGKVGKIKSDASKVKKHFDIRTKTLVFATAEGVTNTTAESWAAEIRNEFNYELVVMPREDIVTSLMDPANVGLCRTHLGLCVALEPSDEEVLQNVNGAASEVLMGWSARLVGKPLVELRATTLNTDGTDTLDLDGLERALIESRRVVIEAPAGRGKTTTLVQLAGRHSGSAGVFFLIDLPAWVRSSAPILQFIAGNPAFQSRYVHAEALARLQRSEHFSFLLNGWNEIAESDSLRAVQALRELERDFPAAGILVATRTHHVVPPLPGALRARLLPVDRAQRRRYLDQRLGGRADELRRQLEGDGVLDELTQTPLILSEVVVIFESGGIIPQTKMGVLDSVMRLLEQSEEHSSHLQVEPLSGRAWEYLAALAAAMTQRGAVTLAEDDGRAVTRSVAVRLRDVGQIEVLPEPRTILNVLCAHHALERFTYPVIGFRFAHQQFQEFYAALLLKRELSELLERDDPEGIRAFTKRYVNEPVWSEPLRMIASEIGLTSLGSPLDAEPTRAGVLLIEMALRSDPVFAAEIAYFCGDLVRKEIGNLVGHRLRALYSVPDDHCRRRALAGMLASGSQDFRDIVIPLLTSDDQQVRLKTYRTWPDFHVSSLGPDWQTTVRAWTEDLRAEFVSELLHFGNARESILSFALADPSVKVRTIAISAFVWGSSREDVAKLLGSLDDETFKAALDEVHLESIPGSLRPRALAAYRKSYAETSDPEARLRTLLLIAEIGGGEIVGDLKDELNKFPRGALEQLDRFVIRPALDLIRRTEPAWVSQWVAERIVDGSLRSENWIALVSGVTAELKERLLGSIENEDFKHARFGGSISVLAAMSDQSMVERVFARLCAVREVMNGAPDVKHELEWAVERQLEELFRSLPPDIAVAGMAPRLSGAVEPLELTVLSRLFGRVGRERTDLRATLRADLRQQLRSYLAKGVPVILREDDFNGELKANLASSIAQVGEPEDIGLLGELIQADIARMRRGREARAKGDRGKLGSGGVMSYSMWHVRALMQLAADAADNVLLEVLKEPEYQRDAAWGLVQLARTSMVEPALGLGFGLGRRTDYEKIWEARRRPSLGNFHEERRSRYAAAIRGQIETIVEGAQKGARTPYDFQLSELTKALAVIDSRGSTELILKLLSLHGGGNGWAVVQTLDTLLFDGVVLPTAETLNIFNSLLSHIRSHLWDSQQVDLLIHALCSLPFIEDAGLGIAKIREVVSELKLRTYQLRDVATALGHSRCPDAIGLLREFASDELLVKQMGEAWINAVAALDFPESRQLLLGLVDPEIPGLPIGLSFERDDIVAARVAELARREGAIRQRLVHLCELELPSLRRALLAKVMGMLGTTEAMLAAMNLIDDAGTPSVPYEVWKQLEATFVEHLEAHGDLNGMNSYLLAPRSSNRIRRRLFEMAMKDDRRKKAASALLAQIEVWRLEYGRPNDEPRNPDVECSGSWPAA
jgi:hypothetical protein